MNAPVTLPDFRRLFESAPGLYLVLDPDLKIVAVTEAYLRATMTRREEIVGRGIFEVFPDNPQDPGAAGVRILRGSLQRVLATRAGDTMPVQKYDIRKPESEGGGFEARYWSPFNFPVCEADGSVEYIIHRVEDVTEFVRLKQDGDERTQSHAALSEHASRMEAEIYARAREVAEARESLERRVAERTAELTAANAAMRDSRRAALNLAADAIDARRRAEQAQRRMQTQLEHLNLLDRITRSIGERQDLPSIFQVVVRTLEDSMPLDFACVCLHGASADFVEVAHLGAKNADLLEHLALAEHASIPVDANGLARCIDGQLVYEPDLARVPFPFPERLARSGLGSMVLAPMRSESSVFGLLVAARRKAHAFGSTECEFLRQLSEHVALAARQSQLHGALQQAYDDLRQSQQAVLQQERLRSLGQMASGIAHDINNALSPVSLYTESLLETEGGLSERARGYLVTIQRAVEDVAHTVARMREFYRQRDEQLELASVDLNQIALQVIDLTRARWHDMAQHSGTVIRMHPDLAAGLPAIMGVESEIREALTNLVLNAVDAMPEGGTLTLRTRLGRAQGGADSVVFEVVDTGSGMDEETRLRCLEPFFTTKGERGTGLGLAMVFGIVQRHSAELEIDSAPGAGTTVRLLFAAPVEGLAEPGAPEAERRVSGRLRLLLVDDDPILLKSLRDALEADGHAIVTANGGQAGVAAFRACLERGENFAAVITDLGMPHMDGRRVAAAIKATSPATPVILLTGWGRRLIEEGDKPPHVDHVLAKPPKLRELRESLALLCQPGNR